MLQMCAIVMPVEGVYNTVGDVARCNPYQYNSKAKRLNCANLCYPLDKGSPINAVWAFGV